MQDIAKLVQSQLIHVPVCTRPQWAALQKRVTELGRDTKFWSRFTAIVKSYTDAAGIKRIMNPLVENIDVGRNAVQTMPVPDEVAVTFDQKDFSSMMPDQVCTEISDMIQQFIAKSVEQWQSGTQKCRKQLRRLMMALVVDPLGASIGQLGLDPAKQNALLKEIISVFEVVLTEILSDMADKNASFQNPLTNSLSK